MRDMPGMSSYAIWAYPSRGFGSIISISKGRDLAQGLLGLGVSEKTQMEPEGWKEVVQSFLSGRARKLAEVRRHACGVLGDVLTAIFYTHCSRCS